MFGFFFFQNSTVWPRYLFRLASISVQVSLDICSVLFLVIWFHFDSKAVAVSRRPPAPLPGDFEKTSSKNRPTNDSQNISLVVAAGPALLEPTRAADQGSADQGRRPVYRYTLAVALGTLRFYTLLPSALSIAPS